MLVHKGLHDTSNDHLMLRSITTELPDNDNSWLVVGLSRGEWRSIAGKSTSFLQLIQVPQFVSLASLIKTAELVVVIPSDFQTALWNSMDSLLQDAYTEGTVAVILVPFQQPPERGTRNDGSVFTFMCSGSIFRHVVTQSCDVQYQLLCYGLLEALLRLDIVADRLLVREIPYRHSIVGDMIAASKAILIPHRGQMGHLRTALTFLHRTTSVGTIRIRVGLDVESTLEYGEIIRSFPDVSFYHVHPSRAGPYLVRQSLAERSAEQVLVFQDSDDVSCSDRLLVQLHNLCATDSEVIGCQVLQLDEIARRVEAVRFPVDVSAALATGPSESLLHGTMMLLSDSFFKVGGLSTNQTIASDTQFLLRAGLKLRIHNANAFLYIRRKHMNALTVSAKTALGSPLRRQLANEWYRAFRRVRYGGARVEDTALRTVRTPTHHDFRCISGPDLR